MNLHFTFNFDNTQIPFLDLMIIKYLDRTFCTNLYRKFLVRSIPYAQYLRLRSNCTKEMDLCIQAGLLRECFLLRGYSLTNLRKAFNRTLACTRTSLLYNPPKPKQPNTVKIITKFRTILSNHWHLLTDHHILNKYVRATPELVFQRATSLRNGLTSSHYKTTMNSPFGHRGTSQCDQCPWCPWILEGTTYRLSNG